MLRSPVSGSTAFSHVAFFPGLSFWAAADPQRCLQQGERLRCSRSSNNQLGAGAAGQVPRFHCRAFVLADVKGSAASFNIPLASIYTPLPRCFQILFCPCLCSAGAISDSLLSGLGAAEQLLLPPGCRDPLFAWDFCCQRWWEPCWGWGPPLAAAYKAPFIPRGPQEVCPCSLPPLPRVPEMLGCCRRAQGCWPGHAAGPRCSPQEETTSCARVKRAVSPLLKHNAASSACPCCEGASWRQAGTCPRSSGRSEPSVFIPTSPLH